MTGEIPFHRPLGRRELNALGGIYNLQFSVTLFPGWGGREGKKKNQAKTRKYNFKFIHDLSVPSPRLQGNFNSAARWPGCADAACHGAANSSGNVNLSFAGCFQPSRCCSQVWHLVDLSNWTGHHRPPGERRWVHLAHRETCPIPHNNKISWSQNETENV